MPERLLLKTGDHTGIGTVKRNTAAYVTGAGTGFGAALITYSLVPFATIITGGKALPVIGFIAAGTAVGTGVCKAIKKWC